MTRNFCQWIAICAIFIGLAACGSKKVQETNVGSYETNKFNFEGTETVKTYIKNRFDIDVTKVTTEVKIADNRMPYVWVRYPEGEQIVSEVVFLLEKDGLLFIDQSVKCRVRCVGTYQCEGCRATIKDPCSYVECRCDEGTGGCKEDLIYLSDN